MVSLVGASVEKIKKNICSLIMLCLTIGSFPFIVLAEEPCCQEQ